MIDGNLAMNSHFENMSEEDNNAMLDQHIAAEKRKEAIAILQFISSSQSPYGIMFGDQPERFADENREYTSEEVYDLYLQSLTPKIDNNAMDKSI